MSKFPVKLCWQRYLNLKPFFWNLRQFQFSHFLTYYADQLKCLFACLIFFTVVKCTYRIVIEASFYCVGIELVDSLWLPSQGPNRCIELSQQFVKMAAPWLACFHSFSPLCFWIWFFYIMYTVNNSAHKIWRDRLKVDISYKKVYIIFMKNTILNLDWATHLSFSL